MLRAKNKKANSKTILQAISWVANLVASSENSNKPKKSRRKILRRLPETQSASP